MKKRRDSGEMSSSWEKDALAGLRSPGARLRLPFSLDPEWEPERETITEEIQRPIIRESKEPLETTVIEEKDKISDLKAGRKNVNINVKVINIGEIKKVGFDALGRPLILCILNVNDGSGSIPLTLWNRDIEKITNGSIQLGSILGIKNGYVRVFQGKIKLTLGREGKLSIIKS